MTNQLTSSAARRITKQLEFYLARKDILITDAISIDIDENTARIVFYANHKHNVQNHIIVYDSKPCIALLKQFHSENDTLNNRTALSKLIRILPFSKKKRKALLSEVTKVQSEKTAHKLKTFSVDIFFERLFDKIKKAF